MPTTKKSSTRWDASTYKATWQEAVGLLKDNSFIVNVLKTINLPHDASVLEIGIGGGKWSCAFSIMGYKVTGIDSNPEMLEQARRNFPNINIEFVEDELPNLKSEASKRKYELVFSEGLIEHFLDRDERIASIRAMGNCCISGGYVYFIVPFLSDEPDEHRYVSIKEMHDEAVAAGLIPQLINPMALEIADGESTKWMRMLVVVGKKK